MKIKHFDIRLQAMWRGGLDTRTLDFLSHTGICHWKKPNNCNTKLNPNDRESILITELLKYYPSLAVPLWKQLIKKHLIGIIAQWGGQPSSHRTDLHNTTSPRGSQLFPWSGHAATSAEGPRQQSVRPGRKQLETDSLSPSACNQH